MAFRGDYHKFNKFDGYGRKIEITKGPTWGQHIFGIVNSVEMPPEKKSQLDFIRQLVVFKHNYHEMPNLTEGRYNTSAVSKKIPSQSPSIVETMYGEYFSKGIDAKINSPNERVFDENMDGITYEHFCADILRDHHWKVQVLPASNDHGADLIGQKNGTSVAIQCKRYSKPYGNSAVQEVTAAMKHYGTDFGVVVSNQQGTSGAKTLAKSNDVPLLNHDDLEKLSEFLLS